MLQGILKDDSETNSKFTIKNSWTSDSNIRAVRSIDF